MKKVMYRFLGVAVPLGITVLIFFARFHDGIVQIYEHVEQAKDAEGRIQQLRNRTKKNGRTDGCIYFGTEGPLGVLDLDRNTLRVYNLRTGEALSPPLKHDQDGIVHIREFSPDGNRLLTWTISKMKQGAVWDLQSGNKVLTLKPEEDVPLCARFIEDGNRIMAVVLGDKTSEGRHLIYYVWSAETGELLSRVQHKDRAPNWSLSPNGAFVLSMSRRRAQVWVTSTGKAVGPSLEPIKGWDWLSDIDNYFYCRPTFSNDNKRVAMLERNGYGHLRIQLRDTATGKPISPAWNYEKGPTLLLAANFSADDHRLATIISGNEPLRFTVGEEKSSTTIPSGEVNIWDVQDGRLLTTCRYEGGGVSDLLFSQDGSRLVVKCVKSVSLFDTVSGYAITPPFKYEKGLTKTVFSPDGTQLILLGVGFAGIWDAKTGKEVSTVQVSAH